MLATISILDAFLLISPFLVLSALWLIFETREQVTLARIERRRGYGRGSRVHEGVTLTRIRKGLNNV